MMSLVEWGGMAAIGFTDPMKTPWWFSLIAQMWVRIKGIREAAAYDSEKMMAPKDLWMDEKGIEDWYASRDELRKRQQDY